MTLLSLFEAGTPDEPGMALAVYRRERARLAAGAPVRWHVDPGNIGLLSRAIRELPEAAERRFEIVLAADDAAPDQTWVRHESVLVPTLRRLRDAALHEGLDLAFRMTTGRDYVLPPPALDISTNDLCGLECNMCGFAHEEIEDP